MKKYIEKSEFLKTLHGEDIQLEDLKRLADELGYSLVKKQLPMPKLLPCKCGRKRIGEWIHHSSEFGSGYRRSCTCGVMAKPGKTKREARENWNRLILLLEEKEKEC